MLSRLRSFGPLGKHITTRQRYSLLEVFRPYVALTSFPIEALRPFTQLVLTTIRDG